MKSLSIDTTTQLVLFLLLQLLHNPVEAQEFLPCGMNQTSIFITACSCPACNAAIPANQVPAMNGCCDPSIRGGDSIPIPGRCVDIAGFMNGDPLDSCAVAPGSFGDPHIKRWNGMSYDYHGACDLVLLKSPTFGGSTGLDIHIRTAIVDDWSYIRSVAVKIGPDVLEVTKKGHYTINGDENVEIPTTFSGFEVTYTQPTGRKHAKWHIFEISLGVGQSIVIKSFQAKELLAVKISGYNKEDFKQASGLMGSFGTGDMLARDGVTSMSVEQANDFGQEWQVNDQDPQLFEKKEGPQWPEKCELPPPPEAGAETATDRRRLTESVTRQRAEYACAGWAEDFENCVADVLATGDLELAEAGSY